MNKEELKKLIHTALKEAKRPDYPDVDGDGDRKEPMAKAFKDKKAKMNEAQKCKNDSDCKKYSPSHKCNDVGECQGPEYFEPGKKGGTKGGTTKKTKGKKLKEAEMTAGEENTSFKIKVDVSNKQSETKLGVRIQLTPTEGMLEPEVKDKVEIAVTKKLNNALEQFDMQVSKDTDVPDPTVLGFFIPLSQIKNMIVKSIKGGAAPAGAPKPPTAPAAPAAPR